MTDPQQKNDESLLEGDDLIELQEKIAGDLSALSQAKELPNSANYSYDPFDADEVLFDSNVWIQKLLQVQAWLNLEYEVSPSLLESDPFVAAEKVIAGVIDDSAEGSISEENGKIQLLITGAEALALRLDSAVRLKDDFEAALDDEIGKPAANSQWEEAWESELTAEAFDEPIQAETTAWSISQFASSAGREKLNLNPTYQRGDVWGPNDCRKLIESVLRGIPLPSIIILKRDDRGYEVVDGKQRLTTILKFIGQHPIAKKYAETAKQETGIEFPDLLQSDTRKFRKLWVQNYGKIKDNHYFPFALSNNSKALATPGLSDLAGKFYSEIKNETIKIAGESVTVEELFAEQSTKYKLPLIQYTNATPRQIHEVFNLYNKQGKKLTAEEIRNALYHQVDLCRLLLMASGDHPFSPDVLKIPELSAEAFKSISEVLTDYRFGVQRYKRTKVLSWMTALLFQPSVSNGEFKSRSTAAHIDSLFESISLDRGHAFADPNRLTVYIRDLQACLLAHEEFDGWPRKFKDNGVGKKWQELQLVGSLIGTFLISTLVEDPKAHLEKHTKLIRQFCDQKPRPNKTQNSTQWQYISDVALGILEAAGLDSDKAHQALKSRYKISCIETLRLARDSLEA